MEITEVLKLADELVFTQTGKHLDYLQETILEGTLNGETYSEIAEGTYASAGHVRDTGAELWKILSESLGKEVSKSNCRAILEKVNFYNYSSSIANDHAKVTNFFCSEHQKRSSPTNPPPSQQPESQPHLDLGNAPEIFNFYGRTEELATLEQWIIEERSRLVGIFGFGGMGKTTLALRLVEQIKSQFEYVIYRNLHFYANLNDTLASLLTIFSPNSQRYDRPEKQISKQISQLIEYLRQSRCLILLDNMQTQKPGCFSASKQCRDEKFRVSTNDEDWSDYQQSRRFFQAIADINHQSCVVAISNEKPLAIATWEKPNSPVRSLVLSGLGDAAKDLLQAHNLSDPDKWERLIYLYHGNPLWLELTATEIRELFAGRVADFLAYETPIVWEPLQMQLDQQFPDLTLAEQSVMRELAMTREPINMPELLKLTKLSPADFLTAIKSLGRRFFVEITPGEETTEFILNPVLREYVKNRRWD